MTTRSLFRFVKISKQTKGLQLAQVADRFRSLVFIKVFFSATTHATVHLLSNFWLWHKCYEMKMICFLFSFTFSLLMLISFSSPLPFWSNSLRLKVKIFRIYFSLKLNEILRKNKQNRYVWWIVIPNHINYSSLEFCGYF